MTTSLLKWKGEPGRGVLVPEPEGVPELVQDHAPRLQLALPLADAQVHRRQPGRYPLGADDGVGEPCLEGDAYAGEAAAWIALVEEGEAEVNAPGPLRGAPLNQSLHVEVPVAWHGLDQRDGQLTARRPAVVREEEEVLSLDDAFGMGRDMAGIATIVGGRGRLWILACCSYERIGGQQLCRDAVL